MATIIIKPRILVVGRSGVGKSSLVSVLLTGNVKKGDNIVSFGHRQQTITVSDGASGTTFEFTQFESDQFVVVDSIGFGEGKEGTVATPAAIKALRAFLRSSNAGYHLVLFLTGKRVLSTDLALFKVFFATLMPDLVPVLGIVVTGCEDNDIWLKDIDINSGVSNLSRIQGSYAKSPVVSVGFPCGGKFEGAYKDDRSMQREKLMQFIQSCLQATGGRLIVPASSGLDGSGFWRLIRRMLVTLGIYIKDAFYHTLVELGVKPDSLEMKEILQD